jgi:hypothetical protein
MGPLRSTAHPKASQACSLDLKLTGLRVSDQNHDYARVKALEHQLEGWLQEVVYRG